MARKTRIAIVGFGNVGRGVRAAIAASPDMRLEGVVSRNPERVRRELPSVPIFHAGDEKRWRAQLKADVAILCGGSAKDLPEQGPYYARFFSTVDSFDTHADIPAYSKKMNAVANFPEGWIK